VPTAERIGLVDKHPLAHSLPPCRLQCHAALSHSIHATRNKSQCPTACCYRFIPPAFTASTNAPTGSSHGHRYLPTTVLQLQVDRGGGRGVMSLNSSSSPWTWTREALARCCSSRQLKSAVCRPTLLHQQRLFAVPDFPGIEPFSFPGNREWKSPGIPGARETGAREWKH